MTHVTTFSRPKSLRRIDGMPHEVLSELEAAFYRSFPHRLPLTEINRKMWFRYGTTEQDEFLWDDKGLARYRMVVGWICDGKRRVGMIQLREWHLSTQITDRYFFEAADCHSQDTSDFGTAVLWVWPIRSLALIGNLLEVCLVWIQPEYAKTSIWAAALNKLIKRRYLGRYSVMLLNACPWSYKADTIDVDGWRGRERWNKRRSAIARLARRVLDMRSMPPVGDSGDEDEWWLWRPLKSGVPSPRKREINWA